MNGQPTDDPSWRVGPGYIDFEDLYLLEVHQVAKASLQPVIAYRRRSSMDSPAPSYANFYPTPVQVPTYHAGSAWNH